MEGGGNLSVLYIIMLCAALAGLVALILLGELSPLALLILLALYLTIYGILTLFLYFFVYRGEWGQSLLRAAFMVLGMMALNCLFVLLD